MASDPVFKRMGMKPCATCEALIHESQVRCLRCLSGKTAEADLPMLGPEDVPDLPAETLDRVNRLFWEKFEQRLPDHAWNKLRRERLVRGEPNGD